MSKNNNIIEINGKRYDALTGQPLALVTTDVVAPVKALQTAKVSPATVHKAHARAAAAARHHPETTKTLMRQAVKPPTAQKRSLRAQGVTSSLAKQPRASLAPKLSIQQIDAQRLRRARSVKPSHLVSRFSPSKGSAYIAEPPSAANPRPTTSSLASSLVAPSNSTSRLLDRALRQATSHLQPAHHPIKRTRRLGKRITSLSAVSLVVVLLAGFITYQNIANIRLHVAASKAGFAANLPGYRPAGFSLGRFNYSPGVVAVHFQSNSDSRSFALTEKPSDWNSQSLVDQFLSPSGQAYQTRQQGSQTIYLYGQGNATWISHGVWYQLQNNSALSDRQLLELAGSV